MPRIYWSAGGRAGRDTRAGASALGRASEHRAVGAGTATRTGPTADLEHRQLEELTLAGIPTVEAANRFLRDLDLSACNARFSVPADQSTSAFVQAPELWRNVLCSREERRVGNDD